MSDESPHASRAAACQHSTSRAVRADFPILRQQVHGKPLVYLDNAATTQKPRAVIDAIVGYYTDDNANVHRGVHMLSERGDRGATKARARKCARSSTPPSTREIIFTRNATEGINLVAHALRARQRAAPATKCSSPRWSTTRTSCRGSCSASERGATLRVAPIDDRGELMLDEFERC